MTGISTPNEQDMKECLEALVAINTENPPGREVEAARFLMERLRAIGFDPSLSEIKPGRANVIGVLANGPGPTFAFNSHIDVVPAGKGWSGDPFRLIEKNGCLFGRGSCDAKGPIVAMLEALRMLAERREEWSGTLLGVFVADEEISSLGARAFVAGRPALDYVVVGEPTSNATVTAHKGSIRPTVRILGATAHSASPDLGENAILRTGRLLSLIEERHRELSSHHHDLVGAPTLTVTRISGGHADNVIPDTCDILIDRRMIPGENEVSVKREFEELIERAHHECGVRAEIVDYRPTTDPAETARDNPIVGACVKAGTSHGCGTDALGGFQGACDLVHFRSIGSEGAILGPGSISVAHKPDEFIPVAEFINASLIYRDVGLQMLSGEGVKQL